MEDFSARNLWCKAGGAITKDKLFYFISTKRQDNETPQPFDINRICWNWFCNWIYSLDGH
jgi:hypothetical protein